ncbi:MAG: L-threonylcarbamoyladenylate synthase [Candidatus Heimdallarchaeaceae archaeon]
MRSNIIKINPNSIDGEIISRAVSLLDQGEIIGFPTDTVYGVAGDIFNEVAIDSIYSLKNRPTNKPINALVSSEKQLKMIVESIPSNAESLIEKFWPGPLTIILKKKTEVSSKVTSGLDTIGVRMPNSRVALEIINKFEKPLATTSANISDRPSTLTADAVYLNFQESLPLIIDSQEEALGIESTIISVVSPKPQILRIGAITKEELSRVLDF